MEEVSRSVAATRDLEIMQRALLCTVLRPDLHQKAHISILAHIIVVFLPDIQTIGNAILGRKALEGAITTQLCTSVEINNEPRTSIEVRCCRVQRSSEMLRTKLLKSKRRKSPSHCRT